MLSTSVDPFDVAREEVEAAVRKVQFMHKEWRRLLEAENTAESRRFEDLQAELRGELQQLDYDLQEVDGSIATVEENRSRFLLDDAQIASRKAFLQRARAAYQEVKGDLDSGRARAKLEDDRRRALQSRREEARRTEERERSRREEVDADFYLQEQQMLQRQLLDSQDSELAELSKTTQRLGQTAQVINAELRQQQEILDDLNEDMEREMQKMDFLTKGMGRILKTNNWWQVYLIAGLILVFVLLLALIIWT